jgi:hypothetical protein
VVGGHPLQPLGGQMRGLFVKFDVREVEIVTDRKDRNGEFVVGEWGMTIAACYVCSEGVVFGADSTWTVPIECAEDEGVEIRERYFNYGQKILASATRQREFACRKGRCCTYLPRAAALWERDMCI